MKKILGLFLALAFIPSAVFAGNCHSGFVQQQVVLQAVQVPVLVSHNNFASSAVVLENTYVSSPLVTVQAINACNVSGIQFQKNEVRVVRESVALRGQRLGLLQRLANNRNAVRQSRQLNRVEAQQLRQNVVVQQQKVFVRQRQLNY